MIRKQLKKLIKHCIKSKKLTFNIELTSENHFYHPLLVLDFMTNLKQAGMCQQILKKKSKITLN